jgi:hypothetical protein
MMQVAHNITMEEWGFLPPGQYLIHDRDGKYCPAFQQLLYAERWVRSVKDEALSRLILFGEASLRHALHECG